VLRLTEAPVGSVLLVDSNKELVVIFYIFLYIIISNEQL